MGRRMNISKTAKEREKQEEKPEEMYKSQDDRPLDPHKYQMG